MANQATTIQKEWQKIPLKDVVDLVVDNRGRNPDHYVLKGIPVIDNVLIKGERKIDLDEARRFIDDDTYSSFIRKYNQENDVLITLVGNGYGNVALSPKEKSIIMQNTIGLRCNDLGDNVYLFYNLSLNKRSLTDLNIGAAQPSIKVGDLLNVELTIPPVTEQRAIATVLSSLDDKIELLREQNKTLEATAQAIFKEWFVNFNFPGATERMIDSELGEIPEGWRVSNLVEERVSEFVKTNIDNFKGTKDYVETANVNLSDFVGNFEKITYEKRASRANMQPVANSIWFARMAESRKYLLFQERDKQNIETKILSTGFAGIKCIKDYLYFYWCFILSDTFNDLKNQFAEGAVQVAISNGGIQRILLALPPKEVAKKFTETVSLCFEKISNNNFLIQTLSALRDALLPKLMNGEVRVKGFKD